MKIKKILITLAALSGFFIAQNAHALCSNYITFNDGEVLTAGQLNSLQTNYTNCVNDVLNGDTFTGNLRLHSGSDLLIYSDTGSSLTASILGESGEAIMGLREAGGVVNLNVKNGTITNTDDSITLECGNNSCSASNPGYITLSSSTVYGDIVTFQVTSDITIDLTGAHWGAGTTGDLTDAILRVYAINDNDTNLRLGIAAEGGIQTIGSGSSSATATDINTGSEVLVDSSLTAGTWQVAEIAWVKANFDDTGGAAEDLWAVQSGGGDLNMGSADVVVQNNIDARYRPLTAGVQNIKIVNATTTNTDDSIRVTGANGNPLTVFNPGFVTIQDTSGNLETFTVTADVTIDLTGAQFGNAGNGDLTDAILRVFAINDNDASLIWGVALQGGREIITDTSTSTTATNIDASSEMLVNTSLTSGTWIIMEVGWFKVDFDDTGGAAEDLWAVQSGAGDLNLGTADGQWQPFNPTFTGFSSDPSYNAIFSTIGKTVYISVLTINGTSDATNFVVYVPFTKAARGVTGHIASGIVTRIIDNGSPVNTGGACYISDGANYVSLEQNWHDTTWTNTGTKSARFEIHYEMAL